MSSHVHPISRKRKERDPTAEVAAALSEPVAGAPLSAGNQLLAGYLAHEFLTKGTLLGKKWPPARPDPYAGSAPSVKPGPVEDDRARATETAKAYDEVAHLLKADGVHIPGVINPTQLARWLQM